MNQLQCPKCSSKDATKSGVIAGRQRYKCKNCGYHFSVAKIGREVNTYYVVKALQLYLEGVSYREIERLLGVSHVSVMNWVKKYAVSAPRQTEARPTTQLLTREQVQAYFQQPENLAGGGTLVTEAGDKFMLLRWEDPTGKKS